MALSWEFRAPKRPDPYLDWELAAKEASGKEAAGASPPAGWCSVLVRVARQPDTVANLTRLKSELDAPPEAGTYRMRALPEEEALIARRIEDLRTGVILPADLDEPDLEFFIYLPENGIYQDGDYLQPPHYRIVLASPPIRSLDFREHRRPMAARCTASVAAERAVQRVAVGIIDDGIAFANVRFRTRTGVAPGQPDRSRIAHVWLQEMAATAPGNPVVLGRRLSGNDIDGLLAASAAVSGTINDWDVYRRAGLLDFAIDGVKTVGRRVAHGTHVMDLACGFAPDDQAGDERPILAVQLPEDVTADTSGIMIASYVLQGLRQIMLWADDLDGGPLPLVVNFSYGFWAGPKDGTQAIERAIDRLVAHRNKTTPTAVVLPAGNSFLARSVAKMTLEPGSADSVDWVLLPDDHTSSYIEIWLDTDAAAAEVPPIALSIAPPFGPSGPPETPGHRKAQVLGEPGKPFCCITGDLVEGRDGQKRWRLLIAAAPTRSLEAGAICSPSGNWKLTLTNRSASRVIAALTVQRDDVPAGFRRKGRQSYLEHENAYGRDLRTGEYSALGSKDRRCPVVHEQTLSAIGNGRETLLVGAAEDDGEIKPAEYASSGPTPGRPGPDLSAIVGEGPTFPGIIASGAMSGSLVAMQGSSAAAPQIARRLADCRASVTQLKRELGASVAQDPRLGSATARLPDRRDVPPRRRR